MGKILAFPGSTSKLLVVTFSHRRDGDPHSGT